MDRLFRRICVASPHRTEQTTGRDTAVVFFNGKRGWKGRLLVRSAFTLLLRRPTRLPFIHTSAANPFIHTLDHPFIGCGILIAPGEEGGGEGRVNCVRGTGTGMINTILQVSNYVKLPSVSLFSYSFEKRKMPEGGKGGRQSFEIVGESSRGGGCKS